MTTWAWGATLPLEIGGFWAAVACRGGHGLGGDEAVSLSLTASWVKQEIVMCVRIAGMFNACG